jgi:hypothetical protein
VRQIIAQGQRGPDTPTTRKLQPTTTINNSMRWDRNYADVLSFAKEHGHLNLPSTSRETRRLTAWLQGQKKRVRMPNCQKEKFAELLALYELNQQSKLERELAAWDRMYKKLVAHYKKYGDFVVRIDDDKTLHKWINYQRQSAKQDRLPEERRNLLVAIDFEFECIAKRKEKSFSAKQIMQWDTMYGQLAEFSRSHDHCVVPCHYEANLPLGHWVRNQRSDFNKDIMDLKRKERLDQLGFTWAMKGNSRR